MKAGPSPAAAWRWVLVLGLLGHGCTNNQFKTPTRSLDRPSDTALFCLELDFYDRVRDRNPLDPNDNCPPIPGRGGQSADDYVNQVCTTVLTTTNPPRSQKVLSLSACSGRQRQERITDTLRDDSAVERIRLGEFLQALKELNTDRTDGGLPYWDPNYPDRSNPCCTADNQACGNVPPLCTRRKLEALVTNTTRGELAVVDTETQVQGIGTANTVGQIENLQSSKPGFGFLPVGKLPQHVRSAGSGADAWAVTSNFGSCDLSLIRLDQVAGLIASPQDCRGESCPATVVPKNQSGRPLSARPAWIEVSPWGSQRALVAFPSCGLLADIDLSPGPQQGTVREALSFDINGGARHLTGADLNGLLCAPECGGNGDGMLVPDVPDGGSADLGTGGNGDHALSGPSSCAIDERGKRILIAGGTSPALQVVSYDPAMMDGQRLGDPDPKRTIVLALPSLAGPGGSQRGIDGVRVAPRSTAGDFAYVLSRDSTVRVIDLGSETECETNPDPRYLRELALGGQVRVLPDELVEQNLRQLSCFPVGKTPRSPNAVSPGIQVQGGALPRDVAFVHLDLPCDPRFASCAFSPQAQPTATDTQAAWVPASPQVWVGDFAWILGSNGAIQAVQIADYCPVPAYQGCNAYQGAVRRVALLQTRSIGLPSPEAMSLPAAPQALVVTSADRLGNSTRALPSRFDDHNPGPRADDDAQEHSQGNLAAIVASISEKDGLLRSRLVLPALQKYYYLPMDPVCDVALRDPTLQRASGTDPNYPGQPTYRPASIAAFPDPQSVRAETWTLEWEGVLAGLSRGTGLVQPDGTVIDSGGLYCNRGVEHGDKLWLPGCTTDASCPVSQCVREPTQGGLPGICLPGIPGNPNDGGMCKSLTSQMVLGNADKTIWAATWFKRYRVIEAMQPKSTPDLNGNAVDQLSLAEVVEPEFEIEQVRCEGVPYGQDCGDQAIIHVQSQNSTDQAVVSRHTSCRQDLDQDGKLVDRCVLQCEKSLDCGYGYVCAPSRFYPDECKLSQNLCSQRVLKAGRCVRAPLLDDKTLLPRAASGKCKTDSQCTAPQTCDTANGVCVNWARDPGTVRQAVDSCFHDQVQYQVRGGDSFLVSGTLSGAEILARPEKGLCKKPADAPQLTRLRQPRLRLGPRVATDANLCPATEAEWISHHLPAPPQAAIMAPSCQKILSDQQVTLGYSGGVINLLNQRASEYLACVGDPNRAGCPSVLQTDIGLFGAADPWVRMEYELFASLKRESGRNSCSLTSSAVEKLLYPGKQDCDLTLSTGKPWQKCVCPDLSQPPCARRIHYENTALNLVLQVPRYSDQDGTSLTEWTVPPEGYIISFAVSGGFAPYVRPAQNAVSTIAQGLRSATQAPDGAVFIVDEGRNGSTTGLRGQLLRLFRSDVDQNFIVR